MIEKGSLDQYIENWDNYVKFESASIQAVEEYKENLDRICSFKRNMGTKITHNEDGVNQKYQSIVKKEVKAYAGKKILRSRLTACIFTVAIYLALIFLGRLFNFADVAIYLGAIVGVVIIVLFLLPEYAANRRKHYEAKEWAIIRKGRDYNAEIQKAREEDKKETEVKNKAEREQLRLLENQGEYVWLYKEWVKIVKEIRSQAEYQGISSNVNHQTDGAIIKVVLRKMDPGPFNTTTYRTVMQNAKEKAISDWRECNESINHIAHMLASGFGKK